MEQFKLDFNKYVNQNSTNALDLTDYEEWQWEELHESYQTGNTLEAIFDKLIEEVYYENEVF